MSIRVKKDGPVTTVIIDRREARNAVDPAMAQDLADAFAAFDADDAAKIGVFWGAHGTFCAGFDLKVAVPFILIFVVLVVRPQGLFGRKTVVRV